ncbi:hypothetical protein HNP86_001833 [Methanococcus maripaludis]|uniref:Uncharacterized protein n=1 Tax=Methanococcus maripaludis TaxID=39152 RepID=A0A7J9NWN4_METMI|nr:hypothetical protein [Methanococcus maripaludis]MBA2851674.1 hypothetical protein [Methanococcus maripaludis]
MNSSNIHNFTATQTLRAMVWALSVEVKRFKRLVRNGIDEDEKTAVCRVVNTISLQTDDVDKSYLVDVGDSTLKLRSNANTDYDISVHEDYVYVNRTRMAFGKEFYDKFTISEAKVINHFTHFTNAHYLILKDINTKLEQKQSNL